MLSGLAPQSGAPVLSNFWATMCRGEPQPPVWWVIERITSVPASCRSLTEYVPAPGVRVTPAPQSGAPATFSFCSFDELSSVQATTTPPSEVPAIFGEATKPVVLVTVTPPAPQSRVPVGETIDAVICSTAPLSSRKTSSAFPAASTSSP